MREKVDPYLRPIYDALYDMMDARTVERALQSGEIEIAPLAFMRGRTLANAAVILDEAQNTTSMQMKMFLTRLGENSRMIVTGDPSQIDLPPGQTSGLVEALRLLEGVEGIAQSTSRATTWCATSWSAASWRPTTRGRRKARAEVMIPAQIKLSARVRLHRRHRGEIEAVDVKRGRRGRCCAGDRSGGAVLRRCRREAEVCDRAHRRRRDPRPQSQWRKRTRRPTCSRFRRRGAIRRDAGAGRLLGDIVIAYETHRPRGGGRGKAVPQSLTPSGRARLSPSLGYDHEGEDEAEEMEAPGSAILDDLGVPDLTFACVLSLADVGSTPHALVLNAARVMLAWGWRRLRFAFAAGAVTTLGLAPFHAWPLLFSTFPVLVWLIDGAGAGR